METNVILNTKNNWNYSD